MDFLTLPLDQAEGCILTHSLGSGSGLIKKGTVLTRALIDGLRAAGFSEAPVARLAPDDMAENDAARLLAESIAGSGIVLHPPFTGRVNIHAAASGLLELDEAAVTQFNSVDEGITVATLANFSVVTPGEMVATVKIIPFAVAGMLAARVAVTARGSISVKPFQKKRIAVISTTLPHLKNSTINKTLRVLEARLSASQSTIVADLRVAHDIPSVTAALAHVRASHPDLYILFGASAVTDRRDAIPAGIAAAGGQVLHVGMPVDPGNLLVLGSFDGKPAIGAPGCARSPRENGFDWILNRLLCNIPVHSRNIMQMGVGGLLKEIGTRPQPREGAP